MRTVAVPRKRTPGTWSGEAEALALRTGVFLYALAAVLELVRTSIAEEAHLLPLFELGAEIHERAQRLGEGDAP